MGLFPVEDYSLTLSDEGTSEMAEILSPRRRGLGKGLTTDEESPAGEY